MTPLLARAARECEEVLSSSLCWTGQVQGSLLPKRFLAACRDPLLDGIPCCAQNSLLRTRGTSAHNWLLICFSLCSGVLGRGVLTFGLSMLYGLGPLRQGWVGSQLHRTNDV